METEEHLLNAVKNYWLCPGRVHDAIAVKLVRSGTIISRMKVSNSGGCGFFFSFLPSSFYDFFLFLTGMAFLYRQ